MASGSQRRAAGSGDIRQKYVAVFCSEVGNLVLKPQRAHSHSEPNKVYNYSYLNNSGGSTSFIIYLSYIESVCVTMKMMERKQNICECTTAAFKMGL